MNPNQYPTTADIESLGALGKIASPLLAGFSISLIGVVVGVDSASKIKYPNLGLLFLFLATALFVLTVQFTLISSRYCVSKEEYRERTQQMNDGARAAAYNKAMSIFYRWADRSRLSFDFGLAFLLLGLTVVLLPPHPDCVRVVVVIISFLFFTCETGWSAIEYRKSKKFMKSQDTSGSE